jgi:hypothetical protein
MDVPQGACFGKSLPTCGKGTILKARELESHLVAGSLLVINLVPHVVLAGGLLHAQVIDCCV